MSTQFTKIILTTLVATLVLANTPMTRADTATPAQRPTGTGLTRDMDGDPLKAYDGSAYKMVSKNGTCYDLETTVKNGRVTGFKVRNAEGIPVRFCELDPTGESNWYVDDSFWYYKFTEISPGIYTYELINAWNGQVRESGSCRHPNAP